MQYLRVVTHGIRTRFPQVKTLLFYFVLSLGAFGFAQAFNLYWRYEAAATADAFTSITYTDPIKSAVVQKLEGSKGLLQISLLAFGVVWGLIITKRDEKIFSSKDWRENTMFIITNLLFLLSGFCYYFYTNAMADVLVQGNTVPLEPDEPATIINFRDPLINGFVELQTRCAILALISCGILVISVHHIKGEAPCDSAQDPSQLLLS